MANEHAEWGGRRTGSGRKASWKSGQCKAVKLPVALLDEVMRYARHLDGGPAMGAPAEAPVSKDERWVQLARQIDQNQEQRRVIEHLQADLIAEKRKTRNAEGQAGHLRERLQDARSILTAAIEEHAKGVRRGVGIQDARSILLALTPGAGYEAGGNEIKIAGLAPPDKGGQEQVRALEFRIERLRGDLQAAQDETKKAHDQRLREWTRTCQGAHMLSRAMAATGKGRGVTVSRVEEALDVIRPGWRKG
ncbi:MAG: hypothetical protein JWM80_4603 [Cyanobacteria bacterium RYN_339]|nr:hypothetical protein [Cyanobacteria bacterium RYN_339]